MKNIFSLLVLFFLSIITYSQENTCNEFLEIMTAFTEKNKIENAKSAMKDFIACKEESSYNYSTIIQNLNNLQYITPFFGNVSIARDKNYNYCLINKEYKIVKKFDFDDVSNFKNNYAIGQKEKAYLGEKYYFLIDNNGEIINDKLNKHLGFEKCPEDLDPRTPQGMEYNRTHNCEENIELLFFYSNYYYVKYEISGWYRFEDDYKKIEKTESPHYNPRYNSESEIPYSRAKKIYNNIYNQVSNLIDNKRLVQLKEDPSRWFLIDNNGKLIKNVSFDYPDRITLSDFNDDGIAVFRNLWKDKSGYININGEIIISEQFFIAYDFYKGLAKVNAAGYNNNVGYLINTKGECVKDCQNKK